MKEFVKRNIMLVIGIVIGLIIAGTIVYATTYINGSNVGYNGSLLSDNVQDAIDEIYDKFKNNTFKTNTAKTLYASSKGVCIERNNKLDCIKTNNWDEEKNHVQQVFSDVNCKVDSYIVGCYASDFGCDVYPDGSVYCHDYSARSGCGVDLDGLAYCD